MTKTVDLERSKRLKEIGWGQETHFKWRHPWEKHRYVEVKNEWIVADGFSNGREDIDAPQSGEMIEWLVNETDNLFIYKKVLGFNLDEFKEFPITDGNICNALADAVIWVLERKV